MWDAGNLQTGAPAGPFVSVRMVIQAGWQLELGRWFVSYTSGSEF
jgi:hypothetical protein